MKPQHALFALVLGAYAYFYQAGGWNQNSRLDLTRAIVEKGTSRIDGYVKNTGDESKKDGHHYCDKAPGMSWMAVPAYAAVHRALPLAWTAWLAILLSVALPSAFACVLLAGLLRAWGVRDGPAYATAAAWALATLAWPYGTLFYGHQTVAALLLIGFALLAIPHARGETPTPLRMVIVGAILGWAVVVEYPAALACLAIGGYAVRAFGWRRAAWIAVGVVPPAIALATYHWMVFGSPTATPYKFSTGHNRDKGFFMGIGLPIPKALWHILFSEYRGLFYSAPWLGFAVPGAVRLWRRGRAAEVLVCAAIALLIVWLNASLVDWEGGWAMGARYLVPCLPFLVLLAGGLLVGRVHVALTVVALVLVAYSTFAMLVGTSVRPEVDKRVRAPFATVLYPKFFRGELAINTQSIDAIGPAKGPHPRRAAWNLGEKLGLSGIASLIPLVLWCGACATVLVLSTRRAARGTDSA
jgi:hypothetical protein